MDIGGGTARRRRTRVCNAVRLDGGVIRVGLEADPSVCSCRAEQITAEAVTRNSNTRPPCLVIEMSRILLMDDRIFSYQCGNCELESPYGYDQVSSAVSDRYWHSLMAMIRR